MRRAVGVFATVVCLALPGVGVAAELHALPTSTNQQDSVTLLFTGDTLIHMGVSAAAARNGSPYDFRPMFGEVRHLISRVDLALCHLEVPLDPESRGLSGFPRFNAPAEVAPALAWAGYDGCSTASNHSYDRSVDGVMGTLAVLQAAGVRQSGMAVSDEAYLEPVLYEVGDLTIGHVSGTYWLNGLREPEGMSWLVQRLDPHELIAAAARAVSKGADLVVVSMHCCLEYQSSPTTRQMDLAHQLIGSEYVDLVVTHHSHMVGPVEKVGDEFVLHGLGNFLSAQVQFPALQDGVIAVVKAAKSIDGWHFEAVEVIPTRVARPGYRVVEAEPGSASFERTMKAINSMGADIGIFELPGLKPSQLAMIE